MSIFKSLRRFAFPVMGAVFATMASAEALPQTTEKVQGKVSGFKKLDRDGWVDVAVVIPTLSEEQLLSFDFSNLLSPNEKMKAGPVEMDVPGNVFVPEQKERYGLIPVTLRKDSFSLQMEPGQAQELFALAVRGPFSELVSKARAKAPAVDVLKLIEFGQLGYYEARDWTTSRSINLDLNQERPRSTAVSWSRSAPGATDSDIVVNLEETPGSRWLVSDLETNPSNTITMKSTNFSGLAKAMLARATFTKDKKELESMRGWFLTHERSSRLSASGVPSLIRDVKWTSPTTLTWDPGNKKGWVTVFHENLVTHADDPIIDTSKIFFPDLSHLADFASPRVGEAWVRVEEGHLTLEALSPSKKTRQVFVFLGGEDLANGPALAGSNEFQVQNVTP
ncbi:MAG: hypothetical protein ABIR96_05045 [Bdellovibrionota bacterium]